MNAATIATHCWNMDLQLDGSRLTLRPLSADDVTPRYAGWLADPRINAYLETRWQEQSLESIANFVQAQNNDATVLLMAMVRKDNGQHIGNIKLGPINLHHLCGDISYFIGEPSAWGQGLATEAISLMVDCGFSRLGLHRIQAGCYAANIGSAKALAKVGFQQEGVWRAHVLDPEGTWQDHLWFGMLCDEWQAS